MRALCHSVKKGWARPVCCWPWTCAWSSHEVPWYGDVHDKAKEYFLEYIEKKVELTAKTINFIFFFSGGEGGRDIVPVKAWPNTRNISANLLATLLGTTCCIWLATLLWYVATGWIMLDQIWKQSKFSFNKLDVAWFCSCLATFMQHNDALEHAH